MALLSYGLKLIGPSSAGAGTSEGAYIGTGWNIGLDIQSGGIQLATQSTPPTPTANNLRIYSQSVAGRVLPMWSVQVVLTPPSKQALVSIASQWLCQLEERH